MIYAKGVATLILAALCVLVVGSGVLHLADAVHLFPWYTLALIVFAHVAALIVAGSLIWDMWSERRD